MITVTVPNSIRDQVHEVIAKRLCRTPSLETRLAEFGNVVIVELLLDLEEAFAIGIDVDEALPDGTVGELVTLVEQRAAWPRPMPTAEAPDFYVGSAPCQMFSLAAERARRAPPPTRKPSPATDAAWQRTKRAIDAERGTRLLLGVIGTLSLAGCFVGAVFWLNALGLLS